MRKTVIETQTVFYSIARIESYTREVVSITHSFETHTWIADFKTHTRTVFFEQQVTEQQRKIIFYQTIAIPFYFTTEVHIPFHIGTKGPEVSVNSTLLIGVTIGGATAITVLIMIAVGIIRKSNHASSSGSSYDGYDIEFISDDMWSGSGDHHSVDIAGTMKQLWDADNIDDDDWDMFDK